MPLGSLCSIAAFRNLEIKSNKIKQQKSKKQEEDKNGKNKQTRQAKTGKSNDLVLRFCLERDVNKKWTLTQFGSKTKVGEEINKCLVFVRSFITNA